ncbi:MAG: hypothetical protein JKY45_04340 [Emcibacter sp.]|nr:hypothetical protein [Emcibacter sp.]
MVNTMRKYLKELPLAIVAFAIFNHGFLPISLPYQLRFTMDSFNAGFGILIIVALPIAIFVRSSLFKNIYLKILGFLSFIGVLGLYYVGFLALIFIFFDFFETIENGRDISFKLEKDIEISGYHYRLYHTVCGAGCFERKILRKEMNLLPGFKIVKQLYNTDIFNPVTLTVIDSNKIQLIVGNYEDETDVKIIIYEP